MTDVLSQDQRSYCMSRIRSENTKPEVWLRKSLWRLGYRYRIKSKLQGKPDIVFVSLNTVVFVDGCFWHKCPYHFVKPKTRTEFWMNKINGNIARDQKNTEVLEAQGWKVLRIWEHEIKSSLEDSVAKVIDTVEKQRVKIRGY